MKKTLSLVLSFLLLLSMAGCSLFNNSASLKLTDSYTHKDPKGLKYDSRKILKNEDFGESLQSGINIAAYPDTMVYDKDGNMIGMYDYDESTGIAKGWTKMEDGTYTAYKKGKEVNLGKPDASKMVELKGDIALYYVVYSADEKPLQASAYIFLKKADDKKAVIDGMKSVYDMTFTAESDTVLTSEVKKEDIDACFEEGETKDASTYITILNQMYGLSEVGAESAYKPYDGHKDPTDIKFDKRVVLTGSGEEAVEEKYVKDMASLTDYVYAKDGKVVAHYCYYQCKDKAAADDLAKYLKETERVSDTVFMFSETGKKLESNIKSYIGYNVLKDDSLDEYVRMIKETYFSTVYEEK